MLILPFAAAAQTKPISLSFGDDLGEWAHDGECDDPRFAGPGMTDTPVLSDDILHDASDCRAAYQAGQLTLRGIRPDGTIDFGDDISEWAKDKECDDMRFTGPGMTDTDLIEDDIMHDATDCRTAYQAGALTLRLR